MIALTGDRLAVTPIFDSTLVGEEYALRPGSRVRLADGEVVEVGTPVGLHIPSDARDRCDQGIVKYIGPQVKDVKIGDYIIFSGYVGTLVTIDNERLIILPEEFAQAVLGIPATDIAGLFFRDAPWHRNLVVTSLRPKIEEYEKLRAGAGT